MLQEKERGVSTRERGTKKEKGEECLSREEKGETGNGREELLTRKDLVDVAVDEVLLRGELGLREELLKGVASLTLRKLHH
jgi:hypothetical protein